MAGFHCAMKAVVAGTGAAWVSVVAVALCEAGTTPTAAAGAESAARPVLCVLARRSRADDVDVTAP